MGRERENADDNHGYWYEGPRRPPPLLDIPEEDFVAIVPPPSPASPDPVTPPPRPSTPAPESWADWVSRPTTRGHDNAKG
jgi:hypothetical protein